MRLMVFILIAFSIFSCSENDPYGKGQQVIISELFSSSEWIDSIKCYDSENDSIILILTDIEKFNRELFVISGGITKNFDLYDPYSQKEDDKKKIYDRTQINSKIVQKLPGVNNPKIKRALNLFFSGENPLASYENIKDKTPVEIIRMLNSLSLFIVLKIQNQEIRRNRVKNKNEHL